MLAETLDASASKALLAQVHRYVAAAAKKDGKVVVQLEGYALSAYRAFAAAVEQWVQKRVSPKDEMLRVKVSFFRSDVLRLANVNRRIVQAICEACALAPLFIFLLGGVV